MKIDFPRVGQIPKLKGLWKEAFGDSEEFIESFFSSAFSQSRCRCVTLDNAPAGMLFWFDCELDGEKFAYLYAVATATAYRHRGVCRNLLENTHRLLKDQGYVGAVLVPGTPELTGMYRSMGYELFGGIDEISARAGDMGVSVRQISPQEYARIRRRLLPAGGLIQEEENLAFLQTQAQLYAGADFLLAVQVEDGFLRGLEYLGDPAHLPGILRTLKQKEGQFRTPGKSPFAMVHPLKDTPIPSYFGLAFD